jgi:hypothetical protein
LSSYHGVRGGEAHRLIQKVLDNPYENHPTAWEGFVGNVLQLPLSHLESVRAGLERGTWKAKARDPIGFIRRSAQTKYSPPLEPNSAEYWKRFEREQLNSDLQPPKNQTKAYVDPARHPELKKRLTAEEQLFYKPPSRRALP